MAQDLVKLAKEIEKIWQAGPLRKLKPHFQLVGSMQEETRIGLPCELDILVFFEALKHQIPFKIQNDPFSLKKSEDCPEFMEEYFEGDCFQYHKFKTSLLECTEAAVTELFDKGVAPENLKCVTKKRDFLLRW